MFAEIVLPATQPETEWVRGRALQKVSPTYDHARVQLIFAMALEQWAGADGRVGTEWRFRFQPPGAARRPLVPDIAYVRAAQFYGRTLEDVQAPATFVPDVVVEVLSRDDDPRDLADKIDVYLACGVALAIVVDPARRAAILHDAHEVIRLAQSDRLEHPALPGFALELERFFARALDLP